MLFGSDWPALGVERWMEDFEALPLKDTVREKILLRNAQKLLGLAAPDPTPPLGAQHDH